MAYLFTAKPSPSEPSQEDNFANLQTTGAHTPIGEANGFQTVDATATPLVSPITLSTSATTIRVPLNASTVTLTSSAAFLVSENATIASNNYVQPANTPLELTVAKQLFIYVAAVTGTPALSFLFKII